MYFSVFLEIQFNDVHQSKNKNIYIYFFKIAFHKPSTKVFVYELIHILTNEESFRK